MAQYYYRIWKNGELFVETDKESFKTHDDMIKRDKSLIKYAKGSNADTLYKFTVYEEGYNYYCEILYMKEIEDNVRAYEAELYKKENEKFHS